MKIKITQAGWAGYTGDLGMVPFVDGVSVEDVGRADAAFLAGIVSIENLTDGSNPSISQRIVDVYANEARVQVAPAPAAPVTAVAYTKETLETIADTSGIKGIREVAEPLGLKGNAIAELIEKILSAQADVQNAADLAFKVAAEKAAALTEKLPA